LSSLSQTNPVPPVQPRCDPPVKNPHQEHHGRVEGIRSMLCASMSQQHPKTLPSILPDFKKSTSSNMTSPTKTSFFPCSKPTPAGSHQNCFQVQHPGFSQCCLQTKAALQGLLQQLHTADASFNLEAIPSGWKIKPRLGLLGIQGFHCKPKGQARRLPHLNGHYYTNLHWNWIFRHLIGCPS
jgi:hypothetical protein